MKFIDLFQQGGFVMYPLLLCSLAIWAVVFEKIWEIRSFRRECQKLHNKAILLIKEKKLEEVRGLFQSAGPNIARPHLTLLEILDPGVTWEKIQERVARRAKETQLALRKFLWILGTIASAAPFIGLFGTVVGIIKSFDSMAGQGKSGFAVVAAGLSEALIATAAGIFVAVMAVLFYNYFQTKLNRINIEFKHRLEDFGDLIDRYHNTAK